MAWGDLPELRKGLRTVPAHLRQRQVRGESGRDLRQLPRGLRRVRAQVRQRSVRSSV